MYLIPFVYNNCILQLIGIVLHKHLIGASDQLIILAGRKLSKIERN